LKLNILNEKINLNFLKKNTKINEASINSKEIKKNDIFLQSKVKKRMEIITLMKQYKKEHH